MIQDTPTESSVPKALIHAFFPIELEITSLETNPTFSANTFLFEEDHQQQESFF
ncbi:hypothetical protein ACQKMV_23740 [Lysinibacillus sp. NPDC094403]|uniref:hypothetical protein n=1 Tax=Lysinibacillus sp. NPDC094403 TaxID=3390581 RepID=UPI003CFED3B5